jgi:hypothetical protein
MATFYFIESRLLAYPESLDEDALRSKVRHVLQLLVGGGAADG